MPDDFDRRAFIRRTSTGAVAVGAVAAGGSIFGESASAATRSNQARSSQVSHQGQGHEVLEGTDVIAHVINAATGEMSILVGAHEIRLYNRDLAQQILRAGH